MLLRKFQQLELLTLLVMSIVVPTGIYLVHPSFQNNVSAASTDDYQGLLPSDVDFNDLGVSWSSNLGTNIEYKWIVNEFVMDGQTITEGQSPTTYTTTYSDTGDPYINTDEPLLNLTTGTTTFINGTDTITVTTTETFTDYPTESATTYTSYETTEVSVDSGVPFGAGSVISIKIKNLPSPYYLNGSNFGYYETYINGSDFELKVDDKIGSEFSENLLSLFLLPMNIVYNRQNYHLIENALAGNEVALDLLAIFSGSDRPGIKKSGDLVTLTSETYDDLIITSVYNYDSGILQSVELDGPNDKLSIELLNTNAESDPVLELNSVEFFMLGFALFATIIVRRKKYQSK